MNQIIIAKTLNLDPENDSRDWDESDLLDSKTLDETKFTMQGPEIFIPNGSPLLVRAI